MNFVDTVKRFYTGYNKAAGLQAFISKDGTLQFSLVILTIKKGKISALKLIPAISIEDLKKEKLSEMPLTLIVDGKGVLTRKIENTTGQQHIPVLLQKVFPNSNLSDFSISIIHEDENAFISLIRSSQVKNILDVLAVSGIFPVSVEVGCLSIKTLLPLIENIDSTSSFGQYKWILENKRLVSISSIEAEPEYLCNVSDIQISDRLLPSFAAALTLLLEGKPEWNESVLKEVINNSENFSYGYKTRKLAYTTLVGILVVLLINALVYFQLKSQADDLSAYSGKVNSEAEKLQKMEEEVKEKETYLKSAGWLKVSKVSWYCDQLAAGVVKGIQLTKLSVNPLDEKKTKNERKQIFVQDQIIVEGKCSKPTLLNEWIKLIQLYQWAEDVKVEHYTNDSKTGIASFLLKIKIHV